MVLCGLKQGSLVCKSKLERIFEKERSGISWFGSQALGSVRMQARNIAIRDSSSSSSSSSSVVLKLPYDFVSTCKYFTLKKVADIFTPLSPSTQQLIYDGSDKTALMGFRQLGFAAYSGDPILVIGRFFVAKEKTVSLPFPFESTTHYRMFPARQDDKLIITTMGEGELLSFLSRRFFFARLLAASLLLAGVLLFGRLLYDRYQRRRAKEVAETRLAQIVALQRQRRLQQRRRRRSGRRRGDDNGDGVIEHDGDFDADEDGDGGGDGDDDDDDDDGGGDGDGDGERVGLAQEQEDDEDNGDYGLCKICMTNLLECVLTPWYSHTVPLSANFPKLIGGLCFLWLVGSGHFALCMNCSRLVDICPICRQNIADRVQVFRV